MLTRTIEFELCSDQARNLFKYSNEFSDAALKKVQSTVDGLLTIEIGLPSWVFNDIPQIFNDNSQLHFCILQPEFSSNWGTDEEICQCMIYNFLVQNNRFELNTGDGGRAGTFDCKKSKVKILTTDDIAKYLI